jgi:hypothetical protein
MELIEIAKFTNNVTEMSAFYRRLLGAAPIAESPDMAIFMNRETKVFIHKMYEPGESDLPPANKVDVVVPAQPEDAAGLTELAVAAKRHYVLSKKQVELKRYHSTLSSSRKAA